MGRIICRLFPLTVQPEGPTVNSRIALIGVYGPSGEHTHINEESQATFYEFVQRATLWARQYTDIVVVLGDANLIYDPATDIITLTPSPTSLNLQRQDTAYLAQLLDQGYRDALRDRVPLGLPIGRTGHHRAPTPSRKSGPGPHVSATGGYLPRSHPHPPGHRGSTGGHYTPVLYAPPFPPPN